MKATLKVNRFAFQQKILQRKATGHFDQLYFCRHKSEGKR